MSTIGSNFTFAAAGTEDTAYGFTYTQIKSAANESADTDAFLLNSSTNGNLYYNAGTTAVPKYFKITDFTSSGGVQIRIGGIYINNVKVNGTDAKIYWVPEGASGTAASDGSYSAFTGTPTNANGLVDAFTVKAVDNVDGTYGNGNDTISADTAIARINLTPVNDAPVYATPTGTATANENQTAVGTFAATDPDSGDTLTYTLSGADAALFTINSAGVLSFAQAPNFEAPADAGANNVYDVIITAKDTSLASTTKTLAITVQNVNEAPVNTVPGAQTANSSREVTFTGISITDPDAGDTVHTSVHATAGTFTATGTASGATITGLNSDTISISGTLTQINAALNGLKYTGNSGFAGDTLSVTTIDAGGLQDVDTIAVAAGNPSIASVAVPANGSYNAAVDLLFTVNFDQAVTVTGTPHIALTVGATTLYATYVSGSTTGALVFKYDIAPGDNDTDGIAVGTLSLNGGTIVSTASGAAANLTLPTVPSTAGVLVDTAAPTAGTLAFLNQDDSGVQGDHITNDNAFNLSLSGAESISGTTTQYQVSFNEGAYTAVSGTSISGLADGTYSYRAVTTDAAGNTSTSNTISVTIDKTAPAAGTLSFLNQDDSGVQGDHITNDNAFNLSLSGAESISGTTTQYQVSFNEGAYTAVSGTSISGLADGTYSYKAVTTDAAGNTSTSNAITVTIDKTAPVAGTLSFLDLQDTGSAQSPAVTQDNAFSLALSGQESGTSVAYQVSTDGGATYTGTTVSQTGLADGNYSFHAVVTDAAGNTSTTSAISVVIDNTAPPAPFLTINNLTDTGSTNSPPVTTDNTFDLNGFVGCGADVGTVSYEVSFNGGAYTTTTSAQSGLIDGTYAFRAVATDKAGNATNSAVQTVVVDTVAPVAGTLSFLDLQDTGSAQSPAVTQDNAFSLALSGQESGTSVAYQVSTDGGATYTGTTVSQTGLADGSYSFHAVVTDAAGNTSTTSAISVVIDNTAPVAGTLSFLDLQDTGSAQSPAVTQDNAFSLALSGQESGTSVAYQVSTDGGVTYTGTTVSQTGLADGNYSFHAVVTDAAGNTSTTSAISVVIDNTAPPAPFLTINNLTDTGSTNSPPVTTDNTFDLNGFVGCGADVGTVSYEVSFNGGAYTTTTSAQSGLIDGTYAFRAVATDKAGNATNSAVQTVVVDTVAPVAGTLSFLDLQDTGSAQSPAVTQDNAFSLALSGQESGTSVAYQVSTDGGATYTGTTVSQTGLADGSYSFHAVVTDAAGNTSTTSAISVVIDNTAPPAPFLTINNLTDTGSTNSPPVTTDNTFDLNGFVGCGADVGTVSYEVSFNGGAYTTTTSAQSGLIDGTYAFRAVATDKAGNATNSAVQTVVVDTVAPVAGTLSFLDLQDTGSAQSPAVTQDNAFSLALSGQEVGTSVVYQVSTDGGATYTGTTVSQSGLADGSYSFHAVVTDAAGNTSTTSAISVVIDNTAPPAPFLTINNLTDTGSTNSPPVTTDNTFDLNGFVGCGADVGTVSYEVSFNGGAYTTTTSAQSGLIDGTYAFRAVATDKAGNATNSAVQTVVVDTVAPVAGTLSFLDLQDTGSAQSPAVTQDNAFSLALSGQESGTSVAYQVSTDGGVTYTGTTVSQTGLADGNYSFHAVVTDAAGNTSTTSAISVTVDNTAPASGTLFFTGLDDTGSSSSDHITRDNSFSLALSGNETLSTTVTQYEVSKDGGGYEATTAAQSDLADGTYNFHAIVTDAAGNSTTSNVLSVTIDNTKPATPTLTLETDSGVAGDRVTNVGVINVTGLEPGATWQYILNDGVAQTGEGSTITLTEDGVYSILVRQTDVAGNKGATPEPFVVTLDTHAPAAVYTAAVYQNGGTLILTGDHIGDLLSPGQTLGDSINAGLDFTKLGWDTNGDGVADIHLTENDVDYVSTGADGHTLIIGFTEAFAQTLQGDLNFGTKGDGTIDKLVIEAGFSTDAAGNVSTGDAASFDIVGELNEVGIPMTYHLNLDGEFPGGPTGEFPPGPLSNIFLENETLGTIANGNGFVDFVQFDQTIDTLHISGGSAAQFDVVAVSSIDIGGGPVPVGKELAPEPTPALALLHLTNDEQPFSFYGLDHVTILNGFDVGTTGIRDSSVISFDDGSVLRFNSGSAHANLSGGTMDDLLIAGSGGDRLLGNGGNDRLIGGAGNDQLYGGAGNDTIFGSGGSDYAVGGTGNDTFVFAAKADEHLTIADFGTGGSKGVDSLLLDNAHSATFSQSGNDTLVTFNDSNATIRLLGADPGMVADHANYNDVFRAHGDNAFQGMPV